MSAYVTRVSSNVNMKMQTPSVCLLQGVKCSNGPHTAIKYWKVLFHNLISCYNNLHISLLIPNCPTDVHKIRNQIKKKKKEKKSKSFAS